MKKAILYEKIKDDKVRCTACAHYCHINEGKVGVCGIRKNIGGRLYLIPYARAVAVNIDPIEKKPLFHFMPGTRIFSLGTIGCNFACEFCQNWDISQFSKSKNWTDFDEDVLGEYWPPKKIVDYCLKLNIPSIAFTYNEPTVFAEYAYDVMRLSKKNNIRNVFVSNGYGSKEVYNLIGGFLDAINIDLKSFNPKFYQRICHSNLEPVLDNIKRLYKMGVWIEITTLVVPGQNDSADELKKIAGFISSVSPDIPWHISRFFPQYKMEELYPTPVETLIDAYNIGISAGLKYVYIGNAAEIGKESTTCPKCGKVVIKRFGYDVLKMHIVGSRCGHCGFKIKGIWE